MVQGILCNATLPPQRLDRREKPSLIFAVRQDDIAGNSTGRSGRPASDHGGCFLRAIIVAVKQHKDRIALVQQRTPDHSIHIGLTHEFVAWQLNWADNCNVVSLSFRNEAAQQDRYSPNIAVALHDWL